MALSNKKLAAKKAKKKASRSKKLSHDKSVRLNSKPVINFNSTVNYINDPGWKSYGHATCMIIRNTSNGYKHLTTLLIDTWALGVKDTMVVTVPPHELQAHMDRCPDELITVSDSYMFQFITGAVDYALQHGHKPYKDYGKCYKYIECLKNDPNEIHNFEYGHAGQPLIMKQVTEDELAEMDLVRA